jgi:hypothetical protein
VPVTCDNHLKSAFVLNKGYKEPDPEARPGREINPEPFWMPFLLRISTDLASTGDKSGGAGNEDMV